MLILNRFIFPKNWIKCLLLASTALLTGCTYVAKGKPILPQDGPTMADIYQGHMAEMLLDSNTRPDFTVTIDEQSMYSGYANDALAEIDQLFPVLPNPNLVAYVHPHLAGNDLAPVPGYYTSFPLYDRTHYALPGEVKPKLKTQKNRGK